MWLEKGSSHFPAKASSIDLQESETVTQEVEQKQREDHTCIQLAWSGLALIHIRTNGGIVHSGKVHHFRGSAAKYSTGVMLIINLLRFDQQ